MIRAFWQPEQDDVLLPYADRFLDEIPALAGGGMLTVFGLMFGMFPQVADEAFRQRAQDMAADPECDPTVRAAILIGIDTLARTRAGARAPERASGRAAARPRGPRIGVGVSTTRVSVQPRGGEQRGVLLLGALAPARHHQHVEVGERRLHLEAGASQDGLHHEDHATGVQAPAAGRAGSRRTGRPASRGGSTSAGRRPPRGTSSKKLPPTARHRGASAALGGSAATACGRSKHRPGQVRVTREDGRQQGTLSPADVDHARERRRSRSPRRRPPATLKVSAAMLSLKFSFSAGWDAPVRPHVDAVHAPRRRSPRSARCGPGAPQAAQWAGAETVRASGRRRPGQVGAQPGAERR